MRYSTLFILQLVSCSAPSQPMEFDFDSGSLIQLSISDKKIFYQETGFGLNLLFTNKTDTTFILYGLNDVENGWWDGRSTYMKPEIAMGSALFVIDANGKQLDFQIANDLLDRYAGHKPIPWDSIQGRAYKGKIIVPAKGSVDYFIPIIPKLKPDGEKYILPKGENTLMFLYFSGHNVFNILSEEKIDNDEKLLHAKMYQGYIMSNSIKLIVR